MRQKVDVEIYPPAKCCLKGSIPAACHKPWEKWCRGCNLVYCGEHIFAHDCKGPVGGSLGASRELTQGAQGLERGSSQKYNAPTHRNGRAKR